MLADSRAARAALGILICVALVSAALSCKRMVDEEERVMEAVREAARAVEAKDLKAFMGAVSKDYTDNKGFDYQGIKGLMFAELMRPGRLRIYMSGLEVAELKGEMAVVEARAFVARFHEGEAPADLIPEDADGFRFSIVMRREDGNWRALSASWEEVGVLGLI